MRGQSELFKYIDTKAHQRAIERLHKRLMRCKTTFDACNIVIIARNYLTHSVTTTEQAKAYSDCIFEALAVIARNFRECMINPDDAMERVYSEYLSTPLESR